MHQVTVHRNLCLPKGWRHRVRSSVIYAISLAHFSLTFARSAAATNSNRRIRLLPEIERLQQELALLQENIRIKDVRLNLVTAHRRPHCPPVERLAILELRAAHGWNAAQTAQRFQLAPLTIAS